MHLKIIKESFSFFKANFIDIAKIMTPVILITALISDYIVSPISFEDEHMPALEMWGSFLFVFIIKANFFAFDMVLFLHYMKNEIYGLGYTKRELFLKVLPLIPSMMVLTTIASIFIFAGGLLLVIPGIYLSIRFSYAFMYLVFDHYSPVQCLVLSFKETKEEMSLILKSLLSVGVPMIFIFFFGLVLLASFLPGFIMEYIIGIVFTLLLMFFQVMLYRIYSEFGKFKKSES